MNLQTLYDVRLAEQQAGTEIKTLPTKPMRSRTHHPRPAKPGRIGPRRKVLH
jgi:hypothetical protein